MLDNFLGYQIKHFMQGIVVGKEGVVFGNLAELMIQPLNDIRRIYISPKFCRVCEEGGENSPFSFQLLTQEGYCFYHF